MKFVGKSMWRGLVQALGVAAVLSGSLGAAQAQDFEPTALRHWSLKAGVFLPSDSTLSGQTNSTWTQIGLEYDPHFRTMPLNGKVVFGSDFTWSSSAFAIPLAVRILWPVTPEDSKVSAYGGLGAAIYFINTPNLGQTIQPGMQFIFGVNLSERVFIEGQYDWVSGFTDNLANSIRVDGIKAQIGFRF